MAQPYTKNIIKEEFIKQLNERPLNKITVKSIVDACQINRNTFYYHYADIYAVLEEVLAEEIEKGIQDYNDSLSWEESFIRSANFAFDNKKAIYHVYHSMQREQLERYLFDTAGYVMNRFVNRINANIGADEEDAKFIAFFYQCALTQIVLKWVEKGMNEDILTTIHDTQRIFDGNIEIMLQRCKSDKK